MTVFYICRHGETENNKAERLSGWIDTPLTEEGLRNIQFVATKLKSIQFDGIHTSDLGRAFITAYQIARSIGYSSEIYLQKGLREVNYGDYANALIVDVAANVPDLLSNAAFVPPNGETLAQMQQRVLACIIRISEDNPGKIILLASHDGPINAIVAHFTNVDLGELMKKRVNPHEFVAKFTITDGSIVSFDEI